MPDDTGIGLNTRVDVHSIHCQSTAKLKNDQRCRFGIPNMQSVDICNAQNLKMLY